jgi:hypothetical protein
MTQPAHTRVETQPAHRLPADGRGSPERPRGRVRRNVVNVVAAATIVAAWSCLYQFFHPHPPAIDRRPHVVVGEVLAGEALKRLTPDSRLIVIARAPQPFQVPASAAQLEGFLRAIARAKRTVAVTRTLQVDPLRVVNVPPGEFFDLIRGARGNDVIVSFLGPPVLSREQVAKLGSQRPHILAVCSGAMPTQVNLRQIFDQKLLAVAVVSRDGAPAHADAGSPQAAFEQMFRLITHDTVSELPSPLG